MDQQIDNIEEMVQHLTGKEANPEAYVSGKLRRLTNTLQLLGLFPRPEEGLAGLITVVPAVNAYETEREWICVVDLPGVQRQNVQASLVRGILHIEANREQTIEKSSRPLVFESVPCRFERMLPVPSYLKTDNIVARLENGQLSIKLAKDAGSTLQKDSEISIG